ncbi:hypothetical protein [Campylobacter sp. MG1]|uniref:hypothetical protein n=1 Tax=Campylobacter sp. MG1 TaxID=2976332 RepID=UPI00226D2A88|nr:hypothetical protein [Campylobacter sp. MG1]
MIKLVLVLLTLVNLFSQELLSKQVLDKIYDLSFELKNKTGIETNVLISDVSNFKELKEQINYKDNYAVIVISLKEKKIDVVSDLKLNFSSITKYYYLKYGFLPTQGAILPILTQPKGKDVINAAVLNGFAELVYIIANDKNIELNSGIGHSNEYFINILRAIFYVFIIIFIILFVRNKFRSKI